MGSKCSILGKKLSNTQSVGTKRLRVCSKTPYTSAHRARESVRGMGHSVRVYRCNECAGSPWHVTKQRTPNGKNPRP